MSITVTMSFNSIGEMLAALGATTTAAHVVVAAAPATTVETPTKGKPAPTGRAAASPSPAAPAPSAVQEQKDPQSAKPSTDTKQPEAEKPKAEPAKKTYEQSGLSEKIANYLGDKNAEGYGERRASLVTLLTEFEVKTGKELKPEQFDSFEAKLNALAGPEVALG